MTVVAFWLAAFGLAWVITAYLKRPDALLLARDVPNTRSLHTAPVQRTGGVAIVLACAVVLVAAMFVGAQGFDHTVLAAALVLAAVGFADDRGHVPALLRFGIQTLAAVMLVRSQWGAGIAAWAGAAPGMQMVVGATAVFAVVWMINLYNFMDGMDGFAGGMAVIGFATLATVACLNGHRDLALVSGTIAAASMGFLWFNLPPARIFMGDAGSTTLGFLAAALSLWGLRDGTFPLWLPLLVFSPFIVDATVTLVRRMLRGERFWEAHRTHGYQRLVTADWGHARTLVLEYAVMLAAAVSAVLAQQWPSNRLVWLLAFWLGIYIALGALVVRVERARYA